MNYLKQLSDDKLKLYYKLYKNYEKRDEKDPIGKRRELIDKFGFDVKFAAHIIRLLDEIEQILTEKTLDLRRSRKMQKFIREGGWKIEDVVNYFNEKEIELEKINNQSDLPYKVNEEEIRSLLIECLRMFFTDDKIKETNDFNANKLIDQIHNQIINFYNLQKKEIK